MDRKKAISRADGKGAQHAKDAAASTTIHDLLGMTPDEVEADIVSRGKTAAGVLRRFGAMERKAAAQFFGRHKATRSSTKSNFRLDLSCSALFPATREEPDWSAVVVARAFLDAREAELFNDGRAEMPILLDTKTPARDGDIVLASNQVDGQALRRFRQLGLDAVSLDHVAGGFCSADSGHPSQLVIHGVVVGKAIPV